MASLGALAGRSLHKLIFPSLALSLCFASTVLAQESQREQPQPPKIIRKSGGVFQGSATKRVEPAYPPLAKAAQISGSVVVEVTLDEEGKVISARALSGHPLLKDAAVAAARAWKFAPTMLEGVPVKVIGTITFNFMLGDPRRIEELEAQVRENPGSAEAHSKLADAYKDWGRNDEAIVEYTEAIRIKPEYAAAYYQLGQTYDRLRRYDEAREAYRQAVRLNVGLDSAGNPTSTLPDHAHFLIAQFHYRHAQYQDAVEVLKQAGSIYPELDDVHIYLGQMYLELGDKQSALSEYNALKDKATEFAERLLQQIEKKKP
jgi:TonB family protein